MGHAVKHDGRSVETFVVYPESKGKRPVVLLIHEIFGMSDWVQALSFFEGFGPRGRLLAKLSLENADLGKHPFFYSETLRPQNRKEYDLCDKAC